jgi:NAD(P)-dependent dehydrogenase (short-subunit alcohol dehydrogenase family)
MSEQLRDHGIAVVALSPRWMHTETMDLTPEQAAQTESTEFVGRAVAALAEDPDVMCWSGRTLRVVDVAREYGFSDVDGDVLSPFWERYLARSGAPPEGSGRRFGID